MAMTDPGVVAAVIVTYHPDDLFIQRLDLVKSQVGHVVIVDNTEDGSSFKLLEHLRGDVLVSVLTPGKNLGIAAALNMGIEWAIKKGYSWFLTLDDDTKVGHGLVSLYFGALCGPLKGKKAGVLNTQYLDIHTGTIGASVPGFLVCPDWADVEVMISSGCFFSVETFRMIDGYRAKFFLDWFDHDFCLRVRRAGLRNYMYLKPMLEHALGKKTTHRIPFLGVKIVTNNHAPQRCYLISRNIIFMIKENFFTEFRMVFLYFIYLVSKFFLVLLFENNKSRKFASMMSGVWYGLTHAQLDDSDMCCYQIINRGNGK